MAQFIKGLSQDYTLDFGIYVLQLNGVKEIMQAYTLYETSEVRVKRVKVRVNKRMYYSSIWGFIF